MKIHFAFFGTDDFSVTILEELKNAGLLPALVVTQPDRPKGRGLALTHPPIKEWAVQNTTPIRQSETLDSTCAVELIASSFEIFIVASYGLIVPKHILDIPKRGTLNVHPSLLPKYRGATPIESQILHADKEVGVTIMLMDEEMDHGPILAQRAFASSVISTHARQNLGAGGKAEIQIPSATELQTYLAHEGGKLLAEVMPKWVEGSMTAKPQDESETTYTKKLTKAEGEIALNGNPYQNFLKIQAFTGSIGTYFYTEKSGRKIRVRIKSAELRDEKLHILRVVPEGKKEMDYQEFLRGMKS